MRGRHDRGIAASVIPGEQIVTATGIVETIG